MQQKLQWLRMEGRLRPIICEDQNNPSYECI